MIYGYARVSTKGQEQNGTSISSQHERLMKEGGAEVIYQDVYTGTTANRPKFKALLAQVKPGDTIVATRTDRFARNVLDGLIVMKELHEKGVDVKILDLGDLDVGSLVGQLMMTIYLIFGKHEAESIRIRMAEGKRMKHILEPDWKEGRPGKEFPEFERYYRRVKAKKMKVKDALLALGMCKPIWYKRCREMEAKMAEKTGMRNLKKLSESNK